MSYIAPGPGTDWTCEICGFNVLVWDETVHGYCYCVRCDAPYKIDRTINPDHIPGGPNDLNRYIKTDTRLAIPQWVALTFKQLWEGPAKPRYSELSEMELIEEAIARRQLTLADALLLAGKQLADACSSLLPRLLDNDAYAYLDYYDDLKDALDTYNSTAEIVAVLNKEIGNE